MRTLKFTHDEMELIQNALRNMYLSRLQLTKEKRLILENGEIESILKRGRKYDDLRAAIDNGKKDV